MATYLYITTFYIVLMTIFIGEGINPVVGDKITLVHKLQYIVMVSELNT